MKGKDIKGNAAETDSSKTMKKKRKVPLKAGKTITHFSFSPFRRNQLRWELHCYRWKKGIKWRNYSYEIRSALKMRDNEKGINEKDPSNWLIEGIEPKPEKLLLLEKFVRKVAPEYDKNFTEPDYYVQAANFFSHFDGDSFIDVGKQTATQQEMDCLIQQAAVMENLVFAFINKDPYHIVPIFAFRQLGKTPCLLTYCFSIDRSRMPGSQPRAKQSKIIADGNHMNVSTRSPLLDDLFDGDSTCIRDRHIGVITPSNDGRRYIGMLRGDHNRPALLNLTVRTLLINSRHNHEGYLLKRDSWDQMGLHAEMLFHDKNKNKAPDLYERGKFDMPAPFTFINSNIFAASLSFENEKVQSLVTQMKAPVSW